MYSNKIPPCIFCFFLVFLFACEADKANYEQQTFVSEDTPASYFEQAAAEEGTPAKIVLLNKALLAVSYPSDTLLPYILDHKIYYHSQLKAYDSALYFADSLIAAARFQKDTAMLAMGNYRKSKVYFYLNEQEEIFRYAYESRNLYLAIGDSSKAGSRTLEMANAQTILGDYTGSQASAIEALKYLNFNSDSAYISSAYNVIGNSLRSQYFFADAIPEYKNALQYSTSQKDSLSYLNNLGLVFQQNGEFEEAKEIFTALLEKVDQKNITSRARYMDNLAFTRWLEHPDAPVIMDLVEAMNLRQKENDHNGLQASYDHLTRYHEEKAPLRARRYAQGLLQAAQNMRNPDTQLEALKYLIALSPEDSVRDLSERYMNLTDSLNNVALRAQNTFAKIKYDEERKQQEIMNLEAVNEIQKLQAQRLQARGLTALLIGLVVILGLFFLIYILRQRHTREKIRVVQKTESRISKVIHDELANDIFNVMSSLEAVVAESTIDKLEKIYLRTRDISRENSDIETGEHYLDYLRSNLSTYSTGNSKLILSGENSVNWVKLGEEKKVVIYRVLQELMVNMNKHSKANLVAITFAVNNKKLHVQYFDNGGGTTWKSSQKGSGLQNVENRILSLNGKISFESEPGKGFKVVFQIPL